jgi:hypothetical protein
MKQNLHRTFFPQVFIFRIPANHWQLSELNPVENKIETQFSFDCNIPLGHHGVGSKRSEEQQAADRVASLER